jgi:uncharacterized protein (DUF885 family)
MPFSFILTASHDYVLSQGALPMYILENQVKEWAMEFKNKSTQKQG